MNKIVSITFFLFCTFSAFGQAFSLEELTFEVINKQGATGTASVSGTIDETARELNVIIDYEGLDGEVIRTDIHEGTSSRLGNTIVRIPAKGDEIYHTGQIDRLILGNRLPALKDINDQSKAQSNISIESESFDSLVEKIKADEVCILLEVENENGSTTIILATGLRIGAAVATVPTMSQWSLFIVGLLFSSLSLVYLKRLSPVTS